MATRKLAPSCSAWLGFICTSVRPASVIDMTPRALHCDLLLSPGRYMLLLSSKAAASCDGAYHMQHRAIVDSIRPHLGLSMCAPYPAWPSQNTDPNGDGLANLLAQQCPGAANATPATCTGENDPCKAAQCPSGAAVACVPKACEGRYMLGSSITYQEPCKPVFISQVNGLPVGSCDVTVQQLNRQARQLDRRLGVAAGKTTGDVRGVDSNGTPQLVDPQSLFGSGAGRLGN